MNAYDWAKFQHHVPLGTPLKYDIDGTVFYGFLLETSPEFDRQRIKDIYGDDAFVASMSNSYPQLLHAVVSPEGYMHPAQTYLANHMYFLVDGEWFLMDDILMIDDEPEVRKDHFSDFCPEIVPTSEPLPFDGPVQDEPDPNIDVQTFTAEELIEAKNIEIARLIDELAKAQSQLQSLVKPLRVVNLTEISPLEGLTLLHELKRVALLHEAKRAAKVGE